MLELAKQLVEGFLAGPRPPEPPGERVRGAVVQMINRREVQS